ncbi:bacterio-opsin activator [Halobiforma lacisalsi AJ5]|uniref:Bacterio-opsin activator n=1 Tax=Natronobacterium lacisalsi AJ5 TaxID=358396 RepID=M0LCI2_NATLA|nr:helix-turn-helix domain-containing protein [Halobiforma lacisalsi]APW99257.1 bacterio-opsin activator [Halobiforma lacisalsi AJ5]EMA30828.1 bacterio-opsin activator HTH domain-containing protein [Halobiforma lacisalsi AJ5]
MSIDVADAENESEPEPEHGEYERERSGRGPQPESEPEREHEHGHGHEHQHAREQERSPDHSAVRSRADGGVVAQLRLDHPDLFLRPTLRRTPDVTVEPEYWTAVDGRTLVFLTVRGTAFSEFEAALETDPTVADPVLLDRHSEGCVYRVAVAEGTVTFVDRAAEVGAHLLELSSCRDGDGWCGQFRFPSRDDLVAFNADCDERGVSVTVDYLRVSDDGDDGVVALTEKQQDLLLTAYEEGYFDVPRGISQDELADRIGVSKSAVSQRLRRAIGQLCGATLS